MGSDLLCAAGMDQTAAGDYDLANLSQVLSLLHKGLSHHGIGLFNGACMALYCLFNCHRSKGKIQRFHLRISIGNCVCMLPEEGDQLPHSGGRQSGKMTDSILSGSIHNSLNAVSHTDVAFYCPLGVGLGKTLVDRIHVLGHTVSYGVDVGCGTAYVYRNKLADTELVFTALGK